MPIDDSDLERVLVVAAHPDDVDFGVAGSVATWTDAGIAVTYCICTDGQAGGFDDGVDRSEIPRIRREEQKRGRRGGRASPICASSVTSTASSSRRWRWCTTSAG